MIVNVHRNLNWVGGAGFSILDRSFKVQDRKLHVVLADCTFVVHPSGNKRAMETGVRNVHAFVRGELVWAGDKLRDCPTVFPDTNELVKVGYSPFCKCGFYTTDDNEEIWGAPRVWFTRGMAFVR